ncbi:Histidine kinase [Flavobacterium daejeonense]|nr:Histidine kinase [Flavobacterium daejeonense]
MEKLTKTQEEQNNQTLQWRFDVNTFRLLGRELITDRVTAVFELVKNCYDANAKNVQIHFSNITTKSENQKIIISDDGIGMSFADIKDKWMVVGTNSKRTNLYSEKPFNRKYVGEKGIGRFAVDKLGERVLIRTKKLNSDKWLCVNINWDEYDELSKNEGSQLSLFTDVKNTYTYEDGDYNEQGTQIIISKVSDIWNENDLDRLYKELSTLVSPFYPVNPPFDIVMKSNDFKYYEDKPVKPEPLKFYSHHAEINFNKETNKQETLFFNENNGLIEKRNEEIKIFGPVKLRIYYFNESAKRKYNSTYKNNDTRIDGIKIYRDGIIATPFAEYEADINKRRDILGLDKRRWSGAFDTIGTREVIGVVDITKENNPKIIDATNRQDFIDNKEYNDLKEFILKQVAAFEELKIYERTIKRSDVENKLIDAGSNVKFFGKELDKIFDDLQTSNPQAKEVIDHLKNQSQELHTTINKAIAEQKRFQKEVERKEKIFYSIVSMQEYASLVAHAVRTSIAKVKHLGEFLKLNFPNPQFDDFFKLYATQIYDEMNTLISVTDFMLSYASVDENFEEFNVKSLVRDLLENQYQSVFNSEGIKIDIEINDDFIIETNKKTFQDIFQNLISNSIKALKNVQDKKIKCSGFLNNDNFTILFSDNGYGIAPEDKQWIFGLYNTRTAEQGGGGVGLFIVEKQIKALNGQIEVIESEFGKLGATFKITLPFNR